uniref:C3H1-type domain-containing protein n=1 Tax=Kalmanozyma brasiliensis (strain GHG001) TaxID=1365824 RepID=V5ETE0_KALBG
MVCRSPWFLQIPEEDRQPWYMREELHTLQLSNNELESLPDKLAEFRGLKRLELHSNRLSSLPSTLFQLSALTNLTLSKNGLTAFPSCLLALDHLVTLNLSHNKIQNLWKDEDVTAARAQREAWDKENAVQENGVWAGLSPSKKDRKPLLAALEAHATTPMRSLRSLDLSHNKLTNAALGIPDLAGRRSKTAQDNARDATLVRLPTGLKTLHLGHNNIRGPVSVKLFQQLAYLEDLGLPGCGIGDDVLAPEGASETSKEILANLSVLDLSGCEVDDLAKMEALFGSRRIQSFDQAIGKVDTLPSNQEHAEASAGMPARQLVRVLNRPTSADIDKMEDRLNVKVLCLLLEGNPLREEAFRQKRGGRSASPQKKAIVPVNVAASPSKAAPAAPTAQSSVFSDAPPTATPPPSLPAAATGASQLPPKPKVVKEEWEILAESGLNTELGRRKLRIEQARREQEAAAAAAAAAKEGDGAGGEEAQSRGRKPRAADDAANSDPDNGAESRERDSSQNPGEAADDKDTGSALANAKLSSKKKEALGQVPCKFFRSNGCSAGASCPFAHTLPGDGGQKSVCQWFLKGSCRFGHKCALAHVLPGQPMSMDRKNKRAAQHGQPLPQAPNQQQQQMGGGVQASPSQPTYSSQLKAGPSQNSMPRQVSAQQVQQQAQAVSQMSMAPQQATSNRNDLVPGQAPQQVHNQKPSFTTRDHDLPFGMPDDFQPSAAASTDPARAGFEGVTMGQSSARDPAMSTSFTGSSSFRRPGTLSQSLSASLAAQSFGGMDSPATAAAFGTSANASRAFGTSPFSHPSGHALFFSGSQDSEGGAGPFARNNRDAFAARSTGRKDEATNIWGGIGSGANVRSIGRSKVEDDMEDAEDFLPSSLSDLLTPAELDRRRRSNLLSSSFAGNDERVTVAQSMPAQAGIPLGSSLGFGRTAIGAERGNTSNLSTGFQQQQQYQKQGTGDDFSPFGSVRRTSGLDSIAFRESSSGLSTSASRTAAHHAPGQSLPQGLAAGLSRLHLRTGRQGDVGAGGFGAIGGGAGNDGVTASSTNGGTFGPSSFSQNSQLGNGNGGLRVPSSLDDYGLGPTAPSSVLGHRSPLTFAVGSSSNVPGHRLSGSFADRQLGNGTFGSPGSGNMSSPFSPPLPAIGSHRGEGGIAIPEGGAQKHASTVGGTRYAQHPATHRLRAGSSAAAPHSPLTLPVVTAEEDEEEAIFELE